MHVVKGQALTDFRNMRTVLTIVGARPQFIKSRAFSNAVALRGSDLGLREVLLHTGQHYDEAMSGQFFSELGLRAPDVQLEVAAGAHGLRTGRMIEGIERELLKRKPDAVLVYGDTDSTLAGALAAAKLNIPVAHVEAGLRSGDRTMPEEVNRILTDHAATWCYTTGPGATAQLASEGIAGEAVVEAGDVMFDVALAAEQMAADQRPLEGLLPAGQGALVVMTLHRPFNADYPERMAAIFKDLASVARSEDWRVLFPIHPRTANNLERAWGANWMGQIPKEITVVPPMGYLDLQTALRAADLVFTDSGGLQKEAFFTRTPSVVMRPSTEWTELVDCGAAVLCAEPGEGLQKALTAQMGQAVGDVALYGGGSAGRCIAEHLSRALQISKPG